MTTEPTDSDEQLAAEARERLLKNLEMLREAATHLRDGTHGMAIEELAPLVAAWIDGEAAAHGEMEPFVDLINATITRDGNESARLRFGRKPTGDLMFSADTSINAFRIAAFIQHARS